jgi:hypothetical protein
VRKQLLPYVGIGVVAVAALVAAILYIQRGAHLELKGSIQKVRTLATDDASAVVVIDFRFVNPSDYRFVVRKVEVSMEDQQGRVLEGAVASEVDAKRLFDSYPVLGQKYNETLLMRTKVGPRESMDRMVAVRFEIPEKLLQARKQLRIRVEDVDGAVSELLEGER